METGIAFTTFAAIKKKLRSRFRSRDSEEIK